MAVILPQDVLWSAQDDQQLQGRLIRAPQWKQVIIYRLVSLNSDDVALNNLSRTKEKMMLAFTSSSNDLRTNLVR